MKIIGITGKSGSGKSYIARKMCEELKNSKMISIDNYFSVLMNNTRIIDRLQAEFPEQENLIINGRINLELILSDKSIFTSIYSMIEEDINKMVLDSLNESRNEETDTVIIEWWGLPKTDLINLCDCSVYVENPKRLAALEKREKYISQEDIDKRDEVLAVDYDSVDYDVIVENDMTEESINKAIQKIENELENPSMNVEMHLDEFKKLVGDILSRYNAILQEKNSKEPDSIRAYEILAEFKKAKNTLELGGFKKSLKSNMSDKEKEHYMARMQDIMKKTQEGFPEPNISETNIEEILSEKSSGIAELVKSCKGELKQASLNTNHSVISAIYVSPEQLIGGKLNCSKDVLNVNGEVGDWVFAQSDTIVNNPYILRKSGKGVCQDRDICMPGEESLVRSENGRAILKDPVYVYMMKTDEFEPVVTVSSKGDIPQMDFSGEWTSEHDIDRMSMKVKKYTDVTEMLEHIQIISVEDSESFGVLANSTYEDKERLIRDLSEQGKIHYINDECGINSKLKTTRELLEQKQMEYQEKLKGINPEVIDRTLSVLQVRRESKGQSKLNEDLDEETQKVFELMNQYEKTIKQIFVKNHEALTHITKVSPEEMKGSKISVSKSKANNYETEYGDWVFASSEPVDGNNPYIARRAGDGMIRITDNTYIYGGDNMEVRADETGKNHVFLKKPNYVYRINPENFSPVVTLRKDKRGEPYFEFSEEWTSNQEVDITDLEQVVGIDVISDITNVLQNYQVFCDVNKQGIAMEMRSSDTMEQAMRKAHERIQDGSLRYINGEAGINVEFNFGKENNRNGKNAFEDIMEDEQYRIGSEQEATRIIKEDRTNESDRGECRKDY